jgi:hypothetical protein
VICPKVNFKATSNGHPSKGPYNLNATDTEVLVHEGELVMGCVDKKTVSCIHYITLSHRIYYMHTSCMSWDELL